MEGGESNLQQYRVVPQNSNTYGIGPSVEQPVDTDKKYELWQSAMLASFYGILMVFISSVYCKVDGVINSTTPWSLLLIPFSAALVPLGVYLYFYVKSQLGVIPASLFCMKTTIIGILLTCSIAQVYLLLLRADGVFTATYSIVFLPSYLCLVAPLIYLVILLPLCLGFESPYCYYGSMVVTYCAATVISFYYLVQVLDFPNLEVPVSHAFYPLWVAFVVHIIGSLANIKVRVWTAVFLLFAFMFSVAQCVKAEGVIDIPWWILSLLSAATVSVPLFFFTC